MGVIMLEPETTPSVQEGQKIALCIEYDGSGYFGWQKQEGVITVQGCLEQALSKVSDTPINVLCAGRTDAGVHATGQIVHFETNSKRKNAAWTRGVNTYLPPDISVRWVRVVPDNFHARFSAISRHYRYIIYNNRNRPAVFRQGVTHFYRQLDAVRMHRTAQLLRGEHDFTSFRGTGCQSRTPKRNIQYIKVTRRGEYIVVDIKANAFLHRMVRNIVGSLMEIGCGYRNENWLLELLMLKNRNLASSTARAEGLYLVSVDYPAYFSFPKVSLGPLFLLD